MRKRILITTGTRADYGLLRPILKKIEQNNNLELFLVVTGSHLSKKHGNTINEIIKDGFKISQKIKMIPNSDENFSMAVELGKGIISFSKCFKKLKPDINIVLGDRDEMFASAIAASHMNIINAHIHGGDISGGLDEYNRHAITKISNLHFAATKKSKDRILKMGENPKYVFFTGSPSIDEVKNQKITPKIELEKKYKIKLTGDEILLLQHPVTTEPELSEKQILSTLNALKKTKKNVIAIAPNSDSGYRKILRQLNLFSKKYSNLKLYENLPRQDYLGMLKNVGILVGNSSSGMIEASYFSIPVINIGIRQKNRERGPNVINVDDFSTTKIFSAIEKGFKNKLILKHKNTKIYGNGNTASAILKILEEIKIEKHLLQKQTLY